jgi:hypothetical protein
MEGEDFTEKLTDHVVICNCNENVKAIVEELLTGNVREKRHVVLMVQDWNMWERNTGWHPVLHDDADRFLAVSGFPIDRTALQKVGIGRASAAIILADPRQGNTADAPSTLTAIAIEKENPQVHTVMELIHSFNKKHLKGTEVNEVVCMGDVSEKLIAQSCISPGVKNIFNSLLTTESGTPQIFLPQMSQLLHKTSYRNICQAAIESGAPFVIFGFVQTTESGQKRYVVNPISNKDPGKDTLLTETDKLIVMAYEMPNLDGVCSKEPET